MTKVLSRSALLVGLIAACLITRTVGASDETQKKLSDALSHVDEVIASGPYSADWESLEAHDAVPEWFRDAKFGIYFHWGPYSVPEYQTEWYPRHMHDKKGGGSRVYKHHVENYGEPDQFGYDRFVPFFTAEKFDATEWAALFAKAGARFAGPVAEHHDGFSMWASKVTPWNAGARGPKRDIAGELAAAIRERGMRFVTTFHHARNSLWKKDGQWTGHYSHVKTYFPRALDDPDRAFLYGYMPRERFLDLWLAKLVEVIDNYRPDLIWFDSWLDEIPESYRTRYLAYYLNRANQWGADVVTTFKQDDLPREIGVVDYEKGRAQKRTDFCWLTDDTISKGSWSYTRDLRIKSCDMVLDTFIDIVSKNGCLLLNISPKADGTIPEVQKKVLLGMGEWLKVNGEAIYNTRPWLIHGEGPTRLGRGGHFVKLFDYGADDIRYTRSKDGKVLYAICLGWPEKPITLQAVRIEKAVPDAGASLLGIDAPIGFEVNEQGQPVLTPPPLDEARRPCKHAYAFKIVGAEASLHRNARFLVGDCIELAATKAVFEGGRLFLEQFDGQDENIGGWNDPAARVHWLAHVAEPGSYAVRGRFAAIAPSALALDVAGQRLRLRVPATGSWSASKNFHMGQVTFDKAGVHHLILGSDESKKWNPVNVWKLELARIE